MITLLREVAGKEQSGGGLTWMQRLGVNEAFWNLSMGIIWIIWSEDCFAKLFHIPQTRLT